MQEMRVESLRKHGDAWQKQRMGFARPYVVLGEEPFLITDYFITFSLTTILI